jgi:glutathione S-transferase
MDKFMILYVDSKFFSPYAMSAYISLKAKNLNFEMRTVNLSTSQNKESSFKSLSITSRVPTLVTEDFSLSESSVISEYLEELYPTIRIYPTNIKERARARQIQAWLRSDFLPLRIERPTDTIFAKPTNVPLSTEAKESAEKLTKAVDLLLTGNKLNLFSEWSIADVDLSLMLKRLISNGDDVSTSIRNYVEHQWKFSAIQDWVKLQK